MSNIDLSNVPVSAIEDPSLHGAQRLSQSDNRIHKRLLGTLQGVFLTVLDAEGRILFFAAGALRRRASKSADEIVEMGLPDLLRGIAGVGAETAYQPEYRVHKLEGPKRHQDFPLEFKEIPFLSLYLGRQIQEASSWGILRVGPDPVNGFDGFRPNGTNTELFLEPKTWCESAVTRAVPGSGYNDLVARLAPSALSLAENYPSAWTLAVTAAYLFGGMTKIPNATPLKSSTVVENLIDDEVALRLRMKKDCGKRTLEKILIDGSNVQGRDSNDNADLDVLMALCLGLFKDGHDFTVYLDANTRHFYRDDQTKKRLDILLSEFPEWFIECPGKTEADGFILNHAYESNLTVLTNDQYRDWKNVHPFVVLDRSRFLRFSIGGGVINIPSLGLIVSLSSKSSNFDELWSLLGARTVRIFDHASAPDPSA